MELIHGVEMDLRKQRYETFADLYVFCYRVAAVVGLMMTHILGFAPIGLSYMQKNWHCHAAYEHLTRYP
jgi:phytoene synthase